MKTRISLILLMILLSNCSTKTTIKKDINNSNSWTSTTRTNYLKNIQDSSTWDYELLETDKQLTGLDFGPFELGAFPVPEYDLLGKGSFKGIGNSKSEFHIKEKTLLMNSFFVKKNELNKNNLDGKKKDDVFFQIIVLTDTIDNENYALHRSAVISRNHPDYLAQGFIKTHSNRIMWHFKQPRRTLLLL